jgi:hypothetical protein
MTGHASVAFAFGWGQSNGPFINACRHGRFCSDSSAYLTTYPPTNPYSPHPCQGGMPANQNYINDEVAIPRDTASKFNQHNAKRLRPSQSQTFDHGLRGYAT